MNRFFKVAAIALIGLAAACAAAADSARAADPAEYEPMKAFAPFAGKTFRGAWSDETGAHVDVAKYEMILNGRALQSTHRLEGKDYGGRTIFFFDEGAKEYVYHYFTTGGFHTHGTAEFVGGALVTEEKVEGHATIATLRSRSEFGKDEIAIEVVYIGKDGAETPGGRRVYKAVADPGLLFPDTP